MNRDPRVWESLGRALRASRERAGLTAEALASKAATTGRTVYGWERADTIPARKPYKLELVAAALGWKPGWVDRIIEGEDPDAVITPDNASNTPQQPADATARQEALELLPAVFEFGRAALAAGGDRELRDKLEEAAQGLVASIPGRQPSERGSYGLVAYRPHGEGEPVPDDDAERIKRAIEGD